MHLLDTSPERLRAHEIQRLQMEAERLAAYAVAHDLALDMKVEPQQPPSIKVRETRHGS
ncbi:hypothetical protein J2W28_001053 [Variovorax boronicumulans]|uniref:hypothetical protein n=1 Tax=Variovorax boronicumulans TaxID=436515 RepID=UPI00278706A3|nr:hypothetical protein [Variovorax boronicumulans]MDP9992025.1 hypothetical protein [Variovorax boronicumulans]MDQ0001920.1 hypothetical protein [Variovorax boronicumulans]